MKMTDFRALCKELVELLEVSEEWSGCTPPQALTRARTALAEDPVGPTDEELWAVGDENFRANYYPTDAIRFARAVLARWGQP
jgi:hypothetical protein